MRNQRGSAFVQTCGALTCQKLPEPDPARVPASAGAARPFARGGGLWVLYVKNGGKVKAREM